MASSQNLIDAKRVERVRIIKAVQKKRKMAKKRLCTNVVMGLANIMPREMGAHIATFLRIPISATAATKMSDVNKTYDIERRLDDMVWSWYQAPWPGLRQYDAAGNVVRECNRIHTEMRLAGLTRTRKETILSYLDKYALKKLCRGRGLHVNGKKPLLITRLLD